MSDERLRELERCWQKSGSAEDEAAYWRERARQLDEVQRQIIDRLIRLERGTIARRSRAWHDEVTRDDLADWLAEPDPEPLPEAPVSIQGGQGQAGHGGAITIMGGTGGAGGMTEDQEAAMFLQLEEEAFQRQLARERERFEREQEREQERLEMERAAERRLERARIQHHLDNL